MKRKRKVRVQLDGGQTIDGVLLNRRGGHYTIASASLVTSSGTTEIDGTVEVPRARVLFFQVLA